MIVFSHPDCEGHQPGEGHPEAPSRLAAAMAGVQAAGIENVTRAPLAEPAQLALAHPESYVSAVLDAVPNTGYAQLDPDTILNHRSGDAARRAAGAAIAAVDSVIDGDDQRAFCAVRPPGHHAEASRAMGFCLFNSIAVAARHALARGDIGRVAVLDFDVHHGNGTQAIFSAQENVLFASSHQSPLYPFSGAAEETGVGNIINRPLPPGSDGKTVLRLWREDILPRVRRFGPELILVSAGFDAHRADPLAQFELTEQDFFDLTEEIAALAEECCSGRVVSLLEGGYDLAALCDSVAAHLEAMG